MLSSKEWFDSLKKDLLGKKRQHYYLDLLKFTLLSQAILEIEKAKRSVYMKYLVPLGFPRLPLQHRASARQTQRGSSSGLGWSSAADGRAA